MVDDQGALPEVDDADNVMMVGPLAVARPNITISNVVAPPAGWTQGTITVQWRVSNTGSVPIIDAWGDSVSLSTDDQPGGDTLIGAFARPVALAPSEFYDQETVCTIPGVEAGNYWLVFVADMDSTIAETDKTDNVVVTGPISIGRPNLAISRLPPAGGLCRTSPSRGQ
jgi:hypothetical protein